MSKNLRLMMPLYLIYLHSLISKEVKWLCLLECSVDDFERFRALTATAFQNIQDKIDEILTKPTLSCKFFKKDNRGNITSPSVFHSHYPCIHDEISFVTHIGNIRVVKDYHPNSPKQPNQT